MFWLLLASIPAGTEGIPAQSTVKGSLGHVKWKAISGWVESAERVDDDGMAPADCGLAGGTAPALLGFSSAAGLHILPAETRLPWTMWEVCGSGQHQIVFLCALAKLIPGLDGMGEGKE